MSKLKLTAVGTSTGREFKKAYRDTFKVLAE
jgi:hypothetical protein